MFKKLKMKMFGDDITQAMLADQLGKSKTYISSRFVGKLPFTADDMYEICDYLHIPYDQIPEYFPKGGRKCG